MSTHLNALERGTETATMDSTKLGFALILLLPAALFCLLSYLGGCLPALVLFLLVQVLLWLWVNNSELATLAFILFQLPILLSSVMGLLCGTLSRWEDRTSIQWEMRRLQSLRRCQRCGLPFDKRLADCPRCAELEPEQLAALHADIARDAARNARLGARFLIIALAIATLLTLMWL
jgi:hypothetical protein